MEHLGARVLIVDDEPCYRESIGEILDGADIGFVAVDGCESALEAAGDTRIGVVLLDVGLGEEDGIAVLERLLALRPGLRIIMLSEASEQDRILDALRIGAADYLAKPIHEEELVLAVRRAAGVHAVASRWAQLRGRLDRLVARLEELSSAGSVTLGSEREALLQEGLAQAVSEVLEAEKTSVMLLDPDAGQLRVVACVGQDRKPEDLDPVDPGQGVAGVVLEDGETLLVADLANEPRIHGSDRDGRYTTASFVVAPLRAGDRPIGVLCATDRIAGEPFTDTDAALLRMLALQGGSLLCPATLPVQEPVASAEEDDATVEVGVRTAGVLPKDRDADELDRDAELARTICQAATDEIEPARVIHGALRPIGTLLPAAPVSLFLLDPGDGGLRKEGEFDGGIAGDRETLDRGRGLTGSVLQTGLVVATASPSTDPRFDPEIDTPLDGEARPYLCVPVKLRGKVVGVLRAFLQEGGEASARTAEVLGAALSAAVRNALLYRSLVEAIEEVAEARRAARG